MTSSLIASAMLRDPLYHIECLTAPSYTKYLISSFAGGHGSLDPIEETDELLVAVPRHALSGHKTQALAPTIEMRRCDGCGGDFRPARPWSRFCRPSCRLRAHRTRSANASAPDAATMA